MGYSLTMLKPDCIERGMVGFVRSIIEQNKFTIVLEKRMRLSREDAVFVYEHCSQADFFKGLVEFLTSGDVTVIVVCSTDGTNAVEKLNRLIGHTDPRQARVGTIRSFGESIRRNLAHSSASDIAFNRELRRLFTSNEIQIAGLG